MGVVFGAQDKDAKKADAMPHKTMHAAHKMAMHGKKHGRKHHKHHKKHKRHHKGAMKASKGEKMEKMEKAGGKGK